MGKGVVYQYSNTVWQNEQAREVQLAGVAAKRKNAACFIDRAGLLRRATSGLDFISGPPVTSLPYPPIRTVGPLNPRCDFAHDQDHRERW